jgi:alpha-N-acetylglucosamine transferase
MLTNTDGYLKSSLKLIKSIKKFTTHKYYDTLVLELKEKPYSDATRNTLTENGWKICTVDRIAPRNEAHTGHNFKDQFTKLALWNFTEFKSIVYFDSDTLAVRNIDNLLNIDQIFLPYHKIGVTRDIRDGKWQNSFNMGVFVMKPNKTEFTRLIQLKNEENVKFETIMSEQGFLNVVYKNVWFEIGFENNANLAAYTEDPEYWKIRENEINIVHFTMEKPWSCRSYKPYCDIWINL